MDLKALQAYATIFMTIILVGMLYGYIVYLYRSEKKGVKDYEKYGNLALDDEINSKPIEGNPKLDEKDKGANK
jgi:cytochrome c oxidase cbb3-type subunit 4